MFRTGSPYSPFFTSGLLSDGHTPSPSCSSPSDTSSSAFYESIGQYRRGSLPTDSLVSRSSSSLHPRSSYFVPTRRDTEQDRSFLSLDLAEARSSTGAKSVVKSPSPLTPPASRDFLRSMPSPKPAPSATLPDVPSSPNKRQRPSSPKRRVENRISSTSSTSEAPAPLRAAASPKLRMLQRSNTRSTTQSSSTVSTRYRWTKRSDALACLEGRLRIPRGKSTNFMSMSDDEDDEQTDGYEASSSDDDDDGESFVQPPQHQSIPVSALLDDEDWVARSPTRPFSRTHSHSKSTPVTRTSTSPRHHRRTSTMSDWLPFQSFMDLKNEREDDPLNQRSWRSFIEIAAVS